MKVSIFIDWNEKEIYSEKEYEAKREEEIKEEMNNEDSFACWINNNYYPYEFYIMNNDEKEEVQADWEDYCRDTCCFSLEERTVEI